MITKLNALSAMTTVVSDTADIASVRRINPTDCTTNPSIVFKAVSNPEFKETFQEAIAWGERQNFCEEYCVRAIADRLAVSVGAALVEIVPGRVSTEVDADFSFDVQGSITQAQSIIADYESRNIPRERILVKLAATWEGAQATKILQQRGIDCNLTLIFNKVQAIACADAGAFLISPFVGRITDWYKKFNGISSYPIEQDPGVISVREIYNYYKANNVKTVIMGASFRSQSQVEALAGCDCLTVAPEILEGLKSSFGPINRILSPDNFRSEAAIEINEARFRWEMNQDAMATELLTSGIRGFAADLIKLHDLIRKKLT